MFKIKCKLPSGNTVYVREMTLELYIALHKYILSDDYFGFYQALDEHIATTVSDIGQKSIFDKFYIYISIYAFSVKSTLELTPTDVTQYIAGGETFNLFESLEDMSYQTIETNALKINNGNKEIILYLNFPTKLEVVNDKITFDPLSAVYKLTIDNKNYNVMADNDYKALEQLISTENYYLLIDEILNKYNIPIPIIKNKIELPALLNQTYEYFAKNFFCTDLKNLFDQMYMCARHLNINPSVFMNMSPIDAEVILLKFIAEKKAEAAEREKQKMANNKENLLDF